MDRSTLAPDDSPPINVYKCLPDEENLRRILVAAGTIRIPKPNEYAADRIVEDKSSGNGPCYKVLLYEYSTEHDNRESTAHFQQQFIYCYWRG